MKKIDNRGFTLVEVIAVVVILAILLIVLVPNVSSLLNKSGEDGYENLKKSIIVAAKDYVNDNRYDVVVNGTVVDKIADVSLIDGKIKISVLLELGFLSPSGTDESGVEYIVDPRDRSKKLDLDYSYVIIRFNTSKRDYEFSLEDSYLIWE